MEEMRKPPMEAVGSIITAGQEVKKEILGTMAGVQEVKTELLDYTIRPQSAKLFLGPRLAWLKFGTEDT